MHALEKVLEHVSQGKRTTRAAARAAAATAAASAVAAADDAAATPAAPPPPQRPRAVRVDLVHPPRGRRAEPLATVPARVGPLRLELRRVRVEDVAL